MRRPIQSQAASVRQKLLNHAETRGEDYNLVLRRYALERFLFRLGRSPHRSELILKGATLFQVWSKIPARPTNDIDFLAQKQLDESAIAEMLIAVCSETFEADALLFDMGSLNFSSIQDQDRYGGIRAKFTVLLGSAKIRIQIDIGRDDIITPGPEEVSYPTLLEMEPPRVLAYPRATVVAEKLEAIVDLGMINSRMKDYFDLWFIFTTFQDPLELFAEAVARTFNRRNQEIPTRLPVGFSNEFSCDLMKQKQWLSFIRRTSIEAPPLQDLAEMVGRLAMDIFAMASVGKQ